MHFIPFIFIHFVKLFKFNLHPGLATPVNGEDVQVGFLLKPDMSDAEIYPEHHGRTLQILNSFLSIKKCLKVSNNLPSQLKR